MEIKIGQEVTTINGVKGTVINIENDKIEILSKGVIYIVPISAIIEPTKGDDKII